MKKRFKKRLFPLLFSAVLAAFTIYISLDTFVITRVYSVAEAGTETSSSESGDASSLTASTFDSDSSDTSENGSGTDQSSSQNRGSTDSGSGNTHSGKGPGSRSSGSSRPGGSGSHSRPGSSDGSGRSESSSSNSTSGSGSDSSGSASSDSSSSDSASSSGNTSDSASSSSSAATVTDTTYSDGDVSITLTEYREYDTTIYVADVVLSSSDSLATAFAQNAYGKNVTETTSSIASSHGAILAINGDFYGTQESGYVIRNGVLYRSTAKKGQEDLVIYADGSFEIICEDDITAEELLEAGAVQVLSFGPGLVIDGSVSVTEGEEVAKAMGSNPRTAIGIINENHYVFVVSDGRTDESEGLTLYQLAEFMDSLGVTQAYNLDGGGSSTMYFNGSVVNNPTTSGNSTKERAVSDIVYIQS